MVSSSVVQLLPNHKNENKKRKPFDLHAAPG
jgi:hypothetical protein